MNYKITALSFLFFAAFILNGCTEIVIDFETEERINLIEENDSSLTEVVVKTDGMLGVWGYDNPHPFSLDAKVLADMKYYENNPIARGDIVVFKTKNNKEQDTDIARVVGLPGETVRINKGQVFINDKRLDAFYGNDSSFDNNDSWDGVQLNDDEYYILADVRWRGFNDSQTEGAFLKDDILGKIVGY